MSNIDTRKNLDEVSFIRPILIVLLVLYHAFAPFCESWRPFEGFEDNQVYWWIGKLAYSFMLPTFVFISGYIWAYQRERLGRKEDLISLVQKKFKRLYLPSLIFGVLYIPLMPQLEEKSAYIIAWKIIEGNAHMWFLPMLFWCFILGWFILNIKSKTKRLLVFFICIICSFLHLPLQMDTACYYLLFFILGYIAECTKLKFIKKANYIKCILSWLVFTLAFITLTCLKKHMMILEEENCSFICKVLLLLSNRTIIIINSLLGLATLYHSAILFIRNHILSNKIIKVGEFCFGVYIFQQFILQILYYHTALPRIIGCNFTPWIGFICALIGSYLTTYLLKKSSIGKTLI